MNQAIDSIVRERDAALDRIARIRELLRASSLDPVSARHSAATSSAGGAYCPRLEHADVSHVQALLLDAVADRRDLLAIREAALLVADEPTPSELKATLRSAMERALGGRWWDEQAGETESSKCARYARISLFSAEVARIDGDERAAAYHKSMAARYDATVALPGSVPCRS